MNKTLLAQRMAASCKFLSIEAANDVIDLILEEIMAALSKNIRVELRGFGSFSIRQWKPRFARNPATGETWLTPPMHAVHFKAGKELKESVNQ